MNAVGINNGVVVMVEPITDLSQARAAITADVDTITTDQSGKFKVGDAYTLLKWQEYNLSPEDYAYLIAPKEAILEDLMLSLTSDELNRLSDALVTVNAYVAPTDPEVAPNRNMLALKEYFTNTARVVTLDSWLLTVSNCEPHMGAIPNELRTIDYRAAFARYVAQPK